jgi:CheY-like chemotaxis protein
MLNEHRHIVYPHPIFKPLSQMKKLMIVDNDADDRMFFREAVEEMGTDFSYLEAINGVDGLEQLRSTTDLPDMIFLDINMPKMDGRELLKELKADPVLKQVKVVMYSTTAIPKDIDFTCKKGAQHFLIKSTDTTKIVEGIYKSMNLSEPFLIEN